VRSQLFLRVLVCCREVNFHVTIIASQSGTVPFEDPRMLGVDADPLHPSSLSCPRLREKRSACVVCLFGNTTKMDPADRCLTAPIPAGSAEFTVRVTTWVK